ARADLSERTVRNLEAGRVRSPRTHAVRLLADARALTGPERQNLVAVPRRVVAVAAGFPFLPDRPRGRDGRAGRCGAVRGPGGENAGWAVAGCGAPAWSRSTVRRGDSRPDRYRAAAPVADGGAVTAGGRRAADAGGGCE